MKIIRQIDPTRIESQEVTDGCQHTNIIHNQMFAFDVQVWNFASLAVMLPDGQQPFLPQGSPGEGAGSPDTGH